MQPLSMVAPGWWDYTTLDKEILEDAASLDAEEIVALSRPGFTINLFDTREDFFLAEALEYATAWKQASADSPAGICGPVGPTEQLPLVARLVNELEIDLRHAHFWGMDEWVVGDKTVSTDFPLSFERTNFELCFNRIRPELRMPLENIHFPSEDIDAFVKTWDLARCVVMQGGQGDVKHWAFNDPLPRQGDWVETPPPPEYYRALGTRIVDLHPLTIMQNARTSASGAVHTVPTRAVTVGPVETWRAEKVSIWHPGHHDNPNGIRLAAFLIANKIATTAVPMSLLAEHPNVHFNILRSAIGRVGVEMH